MKDTSFQYRLILYSASPTTYCRKFNPTYDVRPHTNFFFRVFIALVLFLSDLLP